MQFKTPESILDRITSRSYTISEDDIFSNLYITYNIIVLIGIIYQKY